MREILFRGFTEESDEKTTIHFNDKEIKGNWVYGYYVFQKKRGGCFGQTVIANDFDRHYIITPGGECFEVIPETLGQYTGLKDKNATKIFENNIVKNIDDNNIAVVRWYDEHAAFMLYSQKQNKVYFLYDNNFKLIEVIGNIHENPELLKECN